MKSTPLQNNSWLAGIFLLLCIIVLIGYVTELPFMMNYLEAGSFWQLGLITGSITGLVLGTLAVRRTTTDIDESVVRLRIFFMIFFFFLLATPLVLSWTNRLAPPPPVSTNITIESELGRYGDRFGQIKGKQAEATVYVLFFLLDHELYRVTNRTPFFPDAQPGDQATLNISTGRWGYRWLVYDVN